MMLTCSKCAASNPAGSRFCQGCGQMFGTTQVQGKTITMPAGGPMPSIPGSPPPTSGGSLAGPMNPLQSVAAARFGQRELTFVVNDKSSSMSSEFDHRHSKIQAANRAAVTLVVNKALIDPADEIGVVVFNGSASVLMKLSPLNSERRRIIETIQQISAGGSTDINSGLVAADSNFDWHRTDVVRRIVLLTDGQGGHPLATAESLKNRGVIIDVIGVGKDTSEVDEKLLKAVASTVDGELRYRFLKDEESLVNHYTILSKKTRIGA